MPVLDIIKYPSPLLRKVCLEVGGIDDEVASLVRDLVDTMRASPGVGLAAPQIGVLRRVIVVDVTPRHPGHGEIVLINPEIISSEGKRRGREGCLSVPTYTADVTRAAAVRVVGFTPEGEERVLNAEGFEAVALQHEMDHLDGILFLDRIRDMKRDLFRRKTGGK